jgi:hypothetical protein
MDLRSTPGYSYYLWVGFALVLIFSALEPAGTEGAGLLRGVVIWAIQIGLLLPLLIGLHILLQINNSFNELNPWIKLTLSGLLGSILFVPLGLGIDYIFSLDDWSSFNSQNEIWALVWEEFLGVVFPVTFTWVAINAPRILRLSFRETEIYHPEGSGALNGGDAATPLPEFFALIPKEIGTDFVYLKAELHYVRVVTTAGEKLVLYNLKDAIADLESTVEGIQTHRSYWVAGRQVSKIITEEGKKFILAADGKKIPVSRRKASEVKEFMQRLGQNSAQVAKRV